jgi:hypothetical protein
MQIMGQRRIRRRIGRQRAQAGGHLMGGFGPAPLDQAQAVAICRRCGAEIVDDAQTGVVSGSALETPCRLLG